MESKVFGTHSLGLTIEVKPDEAYEEFSPYDPSDTYRNVVVSLKVGNVTVYSESSLLNNRVPEEEQVQNFAAAMLTRLWGINETWNGERHVTQLPKREYDRD